MQFRRASSCSTGTEPGLALTDHRVLSCRADGCPMTSRPVPSRPRQHRSRGSMSPLNSNLLCRCPVLAIAKVSVRLSVCLSHYATLSERCRLASRNLYCWLSEKNSFRIRKAFPEIRKRLPRSMGLNKRGQEKVTIFNQ